MRRQVRRSDVLRFVSGFPSGLGGMRFVAIKSRERQAVLMPHKTRDLLVGQRTMLTNASRAHLAERGIIAAKGPLRGS